MPLAAYLKQYFAQHKKHGSKDRKQITELCYCYCRLGHALPSLPAEERVKVALFLCSNELKQWTALYNEQWQQQHNALLEKRLAFVQSMYPSFNTKDLFPWLSECSKTIDSIAFAISHLVQPRVFLRIRPGHEAVVVNTLQEQQVAFEQPSANCISLPPNSKTAEILAINKTAVVQDYSSQRVGETLQRLQSLEPQTTWKVWDCCAASGGKSILVTDILHPQQLTVSDVRASIIHNLQQRFKEAGISRYHWFVTDLTKEKGFLENRSFNLVVCDVPCSGSGTWGRTPEQLLYFNEEKLQHYVQLQQDIVHNIAPQLQPDTYFLYITCSVFAAENEQMVTVLQQQYQFALLHSEVLKGYSSQADTMFVALFKTA